MTEIFDLIDDSDPMRDQLQELRIFGEPAALLFFTATCEEVFLHWESDTASRGYIVCPGALCPACFLGAAPTQVSLLPVVNIESRAIEVLRIPTKKALGSLSSIVPPLLRDQAIFNKLVMLSRRGNRYSAELRVLPDSADRCTDLIESYIAARQEGLLLVSAFQRMSPEEMAEIERIQRKLAVVGGYPPAPKGA